MTPHPPPDRVPGRSEPPPPPPLPSGWSKSVAPPDPGTRPPGLPPKTGPEPAGEVTIDTPAGAALLEQADRCAASAADHMAADKHTLAVEDLDLAHRALTVRRMLAAAHAEEIVDPPDAGEADRHHGFLEQLADEFRGAGTPTAVRVAQRIERHLADQPEPGLPPTPEPEPGP